MHDSSFGENRYEKPTDPIGRGQSKSDRVVLRKIRGVHPAAFALNFGRRRRRTVRLYLAPAFSLQTHDCCDVYRLKHLSAFCCFFQYRLFLVCARRTASSSLFRPSSIAGPPANSPVRPLTRPLTRSTVRPPAPQ